MLLHNTVVADQDFIYYDVGNTNFQNAQMRRTVLKSQLKLSSLNYKAQKTLKVMPLLTLTTRPIETIDNSYNSRMENQSSSMRLTIFD